MKNVGQISILHLILLAMTCIGLKNHVTILPALLETVKRDGWASVLFAIVIILPWLYIILYIHKQTNLQPINVWLNEKIGKVFSAIILYSTIIFIYVLAAFTMRETIVWISSTFLINTPQILLISIYIFVCFLLVSTNIQTIVITNAFLLFIINILGFFVAIVNLQVKNYTLLLPMFEHGFTPILKGAIFQASGLVELIFIIFLQHHLKNKLKWRHLLIMVLIVGGLTLGPLTGAIVEFGPEEAAKQKYPAYEEWGLVTLGRYIDHMDFLSIYQWLSGTFIRVGLLLFIVADILNIAGKPKKIWLWMVPPFFFLNLILYVIDDTYFFQLNNFYFLVTSLIFLFILSIILFTISYIKRQKNHNEQESVMRNNGSKTEGVSGTNSQSENRTSTESTNENNEQNGGTNNESTDKSTSRQSNNE